MRKISRVLVIEPVAILRAGLSAILTSTFANVAIIEAGSWLDAIKQATRGPWSLIVIEPLWSDGDGIEFLRKLRATNPETPLLVLSGGSESHLGVAAMNAGANGFQSKTASCAEIATALSRVAQGHRHASAMLEERVKASHSPFARREGYAALSEKERTVLHALAVGLTAKEVAIQLGVAASSVGTYRGRLLQKLRLRTTAELIRYVSEHRLGGGSASPFEKPQRLFGREAEGERELSVGVG